MKEVRRTGLVKNKHLKLERNIVNEPVRVVVLEHVTVDNNQPSINFP